MLFLLFLKILWINSLQFVQFIKNSADMCLYNSKIHSFVLFFNSFYKHLMFIVCFCTDRTIQLCKISVFCYNGSSVSELYFGQAILRNTHKSTHETHYQSLFLEFFHFLPCNESVFQFRIAILSSSSLSAFSKTASTMPISRLFLTNHSCAERLQLIHAT